MPDTEDRFNLTHGFKGLSVAGWLQGSSSIMAEGHGKAKMLVLGSQ